LKLQIFGSFCVHRFVMLQELLGGQGPDGRPVGGEPPSLESCQTLASKIAAVASCKAAGNADYTRGKLMKAHTAGKKALQDSCINYAMALQHLAAAQEQAAEELVDEAASATLAQLDELQVPLYLNLAAGNLLMEEWDPALACCTQVLQQCNASIAAAYEAVSSAADSAAASAVAALSEAEATQVCKALYRRSQAHQGKSELSLAREDLIVALRVRPADAALRQQLRAVNKILREEAAQLALKQQTEAGKQRRAAEAATAAASKQSKPAAIAAAEQAAELAAAVPTTRAAPAYSAQAGDGLDATADTAQQATGENFIAAASSEKGSSNSDEVAELTQHSSDSNATTAATKAAVANSADADVNLNDPSLTDNGGISADGTYRWSQTLYEVGVSI
jgi:trimeric autotransporter adhesin